MMQFAEDGRMNLFKRVINVFKISKKSLAASILFIAGIVVIGVSGAYSRDWKVIAGLVMTFMGWLLVQLSRPIRKNLPTPGPLKLSSTVIKQLLSKPFNGHVTIRNNPGNHVVWVGGLAGTIDDVGPGKGNMVMSGSSRRFFATRDSRLSAIAMRDGDIINIENPEAEE
jgi:hypothetical protein